MREAIVSASALVAIESGLHRWTIDKVAAKSKCAKGLVNYHHRTKALLLEATARHVADRRFRRRIHVFTQHQGTDALDALWPELVADVRDGWFGAWLGLLSDGKLRTAVLAGRPAYLEQLRQILLPSLGITVSLDQAERVDAALDGFELGLIYGKAGADLQDEYYRLWFELLESAEISDLQT